MNDKDIRWIQRFANYRKALSRLSQAVDILSGQENGELDDLLKEGLIQRFEYTHELAWKVMKDYAEYQGYSDIRGSRDAIRKALEINLIFDRRWMGRAADCRRVMDIGMGYPAYQKCSSYSRIRCDQDSAFII